MTEIEADKIFMDIAKQVSKFSKANRKKVGSIIVSREGKIIGTGYNGTPSGVPNSCESEEGKTHEYVIHSEVNAIFNATTHDLAGSTLYVTMSPCIKCAAAIVQKNFKKVVFGEAYRCLDGVAFIAAAGIKVTNLSEYGYKI